MDGLTDQAVEFWSEGHSLRAYQTNTTTISFQRFGKNSEPRHHRHGPSWDRLKTTGDAPWQRLQVRSARRLECRFRTSSPQSEPSSTSIRIELIHTSQAHARRPSGHHAERAALPGSSTSPARTTHVWTLFRKASGDAMGLPCSRARWVSTASGSGNANSSVPMARKMAPWPGVAIHERGGRGVFHW